MRTMQVCGHKARNGIHDRDVEKGELVEERS